MQIRPAAATDVARVVAIDEAATGEAKPRYWQSLFESFSQNRAGCRAFLVAELKGEVVGFICGEVRDFEFGAESCGWVFALTVDPAIRVNSIGTQLFEEICLIFTQAGVRKVRTMIEHDNQLVMAFFRSQGLMVGRFIGMEKNLD
ncbi:GNAT family N-acetyltransferase [Rhodopseudomonas palustris]|uniref:GNAT family N-acetyltransferase n=1 Tax=Rhodopseudomonas palustris TaxID=1076 RepID=UPI001F32FF23|nr:GNAT family N-acetyltransferase [Rhodopseudomonas palustris]